MSGDDPIRSVFPAGDGNALQRVLAVLSSTPSPADALHEVAEAALSLTGSDSVAIGLLDATGTQLQFVAVAGRSGTDVIGLSIRVEDSLADGALRSGEPRCYAASDPAGAAPAILGLRSSAVAPIKRGGRVVGALVALGGDAEGHGEPIDLRTLALLADAAAIAIDRAEAVRRDAAQSRELAVLYGAAQSMGASLNVQEVVAAILQAVCGHLEHRAAALFLLNDERTHLFVAAHQGLTDEERDVQMSAEAHPLAALLETGSAQVVEGDDCEPVLQGLADGRTVRSAIVAPVRSRADLLGLLVVLSGQPGAYSQDDARLVSALSSQAGVAIQNAWLYEDATRQAEEAGALHELSQVVNATLDLDRVLGFAADSVPALLNADMFAVMMLDHRDGRLATRVYRGDHEREFSAVKPHPGEGIAGWVCQWVTPTAVADVAADARNHTARIDGAGVVSALCVPVSMSDSVIGVMMAMSSRRRLFTVAEMELLYTVANQTAVAIANAIRYREVRGRSADMQRYFGRIARALGAAFHGTQALQLTADLVLALMRGDRCTIYRTDGTAPALVVAAGRRMGAVDDAAAPAGEGLTGWIARRGLPVALPVVGDDPRGAVQGWSSRDRPASYLGVPIKIGRRTVGVMEVMSHEPRPFGDREARLVLHFLRQAQIAAHLAGEHVASFDEVNGQAGR